MIRLSRILVDLWPQDFFNLVYTLEFVLYYDLSQFVSLPRQSWSLFFWTAMIMRVEFLSNPFLPGIAYKLLIMRIEFLSIPFLPGIVYKLVGPDLSPNSNALYVRMIIDNDDTDTS